MIATPSKIVQIDLHDESKQTFATIGKNSQKRAAGNDTTRHKLRLKNTERLIGLQAVEHKPPQNSSYSPLAGIKFLILSYKP